MLPDHELIKKLRMKFLSEGLDSLTREETLDLINHLYQAYEDLQSMGKPVLTISLDDTDETWKLLRDMAINHRMIIRTASQERRTFNDKPSNNNSRVSR